MANAIGWVQLRMSGGFKVVGILTGLYGAVISLFMIAQFRFEYNPRRIAEEWCSILLYIQMAALILYGTFRVMGGIRNDTKLGMMESHRMMPISGVDAALGYISVPVIQLIPFSILNLAFGLAMAFRAGVSPVNLLFSHALIWAMAIVLWIIMALGALVVKQAAIVLSLAVLIAFLSQGMIVVFFPSVLVLATPLIGDGVLTLSRAHALNSGQMIALVLQAVVGVQFFFAAARKYQFADRPAFDGLRGLLLMLTWVGLYLVTVIDRTDFQPPHFLRVFNSEEGIPVHLISTMLTGFLIALVPIGSAARRADTAKRNGISPMMLLVLTILIALLPVVGILVNPPHAVDGIIFHKGVLLHGMGLSILIVAAFVLTTYCLLRLIPPGKPILRLNLVMLWIGLTWLGPLVIEAIFQAVINNQDHSSSSGPSPLMAMGPLGALIETWCLPRSGPGPGIAVQWGATILFMLLLWRRTRKRKAAQKIAAA